MFEGYVRVAVATPTIRVADCDYNAKQILNLIQKADKEQVRLLCLTELCITGYTCGDLFLQDSLLNAAKKSLMWLVEESKEYNVLVIVGLPLSHNGKLYNGAAVFCKGQLLGFVPKSYMPNYGEFYELRHFSPALNQIDRKVDWIDSVPFATNILFCCEEFPEFKLAVEICEDFWTPSPPSIGHAMAGATVIANLSASSEHIGKSDYRRSLAASQSGRLICGYLYGSAGYGESTTDTVFSGHNIICENGIILEESYPFEKGWAVSEIDISALAYDRRRINSFNIKNSGENYTKIYFSLDTSSLELCRFIEPRPFIMRAKKEWDTGIALRIQAAGLAKRLDHINCRSIVIGVSGGLDSTLAVLAAVEACEMRKRPISDILAVTMPCFGTTERTRSNAHKLCDSLEIPIKEIDITQSVIQHLHEIGHSKDKRDVVYENAQARMRTLVLMNLANKTNGLVLGTGDMSELALGWATYNGDHMSMYGINIGVPKTLVYHLIQCKALSSDNAALAEVLTDILATPVSPELLPPQDGDIVQITEDVVGPYELHDFFLYHILRWGRNPKTIYYLACSCISFDEDYDPHIILKWLKVFYQRFFAHQFKRSCLPDGPKIVCVSLSPRGDWRMPSDAMCTIWLKELKDLEKELVNKPLG